jgi:hypothetical protein
MWLRDYLPFDIPDLRVFIYGYPATLQRSPSRAGIYDFTQGFTNAILSLRSGPEASLQSAHTLPNANNTYQVAQTPLILVGHSLGCIIIKQVRSRRKSHLYLLISEGPYRIFVIRDIYPALPPISLWYGVFWSASPWAPQPTTTEYPLFNASRRSGSGLTTRFFPSDFAQPTLSIRL